MVILKIRGQHPNLRPNFQTHNNAGDKILLCIQVDIYMSYIPTKYKENWRTLLIYRPIPPHQTRRFAPRCVNLFEPRRESVPAWSTLLPHSFGRLRRHFLLKNHISANLWNFQIFIQISKKGLWPSVFLKSLTFSTIFKKSCWNGDFENQRSTPQLGIKFSNP